MNEYKLNLILAASQAFLLAIAELDAEPQTLESTDNTQNLQELDVTAIRTAMKASCDTATAAQRLCNDLSALIQQLEPPE